MEKRRGTIEQSRLRKNLDGSMEKIGRKGEI